MIWTNGRCELADGRVLFVWTGGDGWFATVRSADGTDFRVLTTLATEREAQVAAEKAAGVHVEVATLTASVDAFIERKGEVEYLRERVKALEGDRDEARGVAYRMARWEYPKWSESGGPVMCAHGIAKGIDCERCDVATALEWGPRSAIADDVDRIIAAQTAATPDGEENDHDD